MTSSQQSLPADAADASVQGTALAEPASLRGQLDDVRPTLVVLVRHFGCIFCREMIKDLRIASENADGPGGERRYPKVVFVHMGTREQGDAFFGSYWPGVTAVSDPTRRLYEALGLQRGGLPQMFGPRAWTCGIRAVSKGHFVGKPVGDPWQMPGVFLLDGTVAGDVPILWQHTFRHAGDHPNFADLATHPALVAA